MVLVGKPEGRRPLGIPRRRWVDNIRTDYYEFVSSFKLVGLSHVNKLHCHPHTLEGPGVLTCLGLCTRYVEIWYDLLNTERVNRKPSTCAGDTKRENLMYHVRDGIRTKNSRFLSCKVPFMHS